MITAFNLKTDEEIKFNGGTTSLWAVCYAHCEQKNQLNRLIRSEKEGRFIDYAKKLPVSLNQRAITCGDWCAKR